MSRKAPVKRRKPRPVRTVEPFGDPDMDLSPVTYKPGHRVTDAPVVYGPSPWEQPREQFTRTMSQRANVAGNSREGRRVYGRVNW